MRQARLEASPEVLAECAALLADHGLSVVGSLEASGAVALVIEGEALPDACEAGPLKTVTLTVRTDIYGRQRLNRIIDIALA